MTTKSDKNSLMRGQRRELVSPIDTLAYFILYGWLGSLSLAFSIIYAGMT